MRAAVAGAPVAEALVDTPVPAEVAADLMAVFFPVGTTVFIVPMADPTVTVVPMVPTDRVVGFGVLMVRAADLTVGMDRAVVRVAVHTVGAVHTNEVGPVADRAVA